LNEVNKLFCFCTDRISPEGMDVGMFCNRHLDAAFAENYWLLSWAYKCPKGQQNKSLTSLAPFCICVLYSEPFSHAVTLQESWRTGLMDKRPVTEEEATPVRLQWLSYCNRSCLTNPKQLNHLWQELVFLFVLFCFVFVLFWWDWRVLRLQSRCSCLSHTSTPFCSGYFRDGVLWTICPGWPQTEILLSSASQVARITGVFPAPSSFSI
jgi:hypothetical protein